jgi:hypothetical protein
MSNSEKDSNFASVKTDLLDNLINKKGEIDYGKLKEAADAIESGRAALDRLSLEEERGRTKGNRRNVEASLILGRSENNQRKATQERSGSQSAQNENDVREIQEHLLVNWAKNEGIFEEWEDAVKRKLYDTTGSEAKVYEGNIPVARKTNPSPETLENR